MDYATEAARLLDTYGPWRVPGRAWWIAAGWPDPPMGLIDAVKAEQNRRDAVGKPPADPAAGVLFFTFRGGRK